MFFNMHPIKHKGNQYSYFFKGCNCFVLPSAFLYFPCFYHECMYITFMVVREKTSQSHLLIGIQQAVIYPKREQGICKKETLRHVMGDFPGGPVVKNPPSNARNVVPSLIKELRSHMTGPTKHMSCNYQACVLQNPCTPTREVNRLQRQKAHGSRQRPSAPFPPTPKKACYTQTHSASMPAAVTHGEQLMNILIRRLSSIFLVLSSAPLWVTAGGRWT